MESALADKNFKIIKYELAKDGIGLKAYFDKAGMISWYHIHSDELTSVEKDIRDDKIRLSEINLCYTILRRVIQGKSKGDKLANYSKEDLERLSYEIEGKSLEELSKIHKQWIGY